METIELEDCEVRYDEDRVIFHGVVVYLPEKEDVEAFVNLLKKATYITECS